MTIPSTVLHLLQVFKWRLHGNCVPKKIINLWPHLLELYCACSSYWVEVCAGRVWKLNNRRYLGAGLQTKLDRNLHTKQVIMIYEQVTYDRLNRSNAALLPKPWPFLLCYTCLYLITVVREQWRFLVTQSTCNVMHCSCIGYLVTQNAVLTLYQQCFVCCTIKICTTTTTTTTREV